MNEYKRKTTEILKENGHSLNNQNDFLIEFTECTDFQDIIYYFYVVDYYKNNNRKTKTILSEHVFLYLVPWFVSGYDKYENQAYNCIRKNKLNKIISKV